MRLDEAEVINQEQPSIAQRWAVAAGVKLASVQSAPGRNSSIESDAKFGMISPMYCLGGGPKRIMHFRPPPPGLLRNSDMSWRAPPVHRS